MPHNSPSPTIHAIGTSTWHSIRPRMPARELGRPDSTPDTSSRRWRSCLTPEPPSPRPYASGIVPVARRTVQTATRATASADSTAATRPPTAAAPATGARPPTTHPASRPRHRRHRPPDGPSTARRRRQRREHGRYDEQGAADAYRRDRGPGPEAPRLRRPWQARRSTIATPAGPSLEHGSNQRRQPLATNGSPQHRVRPPPHADRNGEPDETPAQAVLLITDHDA